MRPLMLLDTASLYFRAFYGVPERAEPGELPRNAITGLVDGEDRAELAARLAVVADAAYDQLATGLEAYGA